MDESPASRLLELIASSWKTQAIGAAVRLGVIDLLWESPKTTAQVAMSLEADENAIERLLNALTSLNVCHRTETQSYGLTEVGSGLAAKSQDSLQAWAIWWSQYCWPEWGELTYSISTGSSARQKLQGTEGFSHLHNDPAAAAIFNRAMSELTALTTQRITSTYDFGPYKTIVDVGGGDARLLKNVLEDNPGSRGVLVDLPHATEAARKTLADADLALRCEVIAGDFFEAVPNNGDLYIFKSVLHDWNDKDAGQILQVCRRCMPRQSTLILIERVGPDTFTADLSTQNFCRSDLHMLVAFAGRERNLSEFVSLLNASGFELKRTVTVGMGLSLLEATPLVEAG